MDVALRDSGSTAVLDIAGKILGGPESDPLRGALDKALSGGVRRLLINLEGVPWMNSAGLGILLSAYSRMRERGGEILLTGVGPRVRGILHTTKLLTVLSVVDDEGSGGGCAQGPGKPEPDRD